MRTENLIKKHVFHGGPRVSDVICSTSSLWQQLSKQHQLLNTVWVTGNSRYTKNRLRRMGRRRQRHLTVRWPLIRRLSVAERWITLRRMMISCLHYTWLQLKLAMPLKPWS